MIGPLLLAVIGASAVQATPVPSSSPFSSTSGFTNPVVLPSRGGKAICMSGIIPINATAKNLNLNFNLPTNISEVTQTFIDLYTTTSPFNKNLTNGVQSVSGTYEIFSEICVPANNTTPHAVQFLTHGIGFDHTYWDFEPGYSYVDVAAAAGYATVLYDRLGVGRSSKPDPIKVIQAPFEVAIAEQLLGMVKSGKLAGMTFDKIVAVGHSFGSAITQSVVTNNPTIADATVLTGWSANSTGLPPFLLSNNFDLASHAFPYRFGDLSNGFIVTGTQISLQYGFFHFPGFSPDILNAAYSTQQPTTFGEMLSMAAITKPAANYTRPVTVVNGEADLPFCSGNCTAPVNNPKATLKALFPSTNLTGTYTAPNTGHGVNLHYSADASYAYINGFLKEQGISS